MTGGLSTAMVLDLLLAGLLAAVIVYAVILNRKLAALRQGKEELRALISDFVAASETARTGMAEMRHAAENAGRNLNEVMGDAKALRDDLSFLIERGGVVADRMEQNVRASRAAPAAVSSPAPAREPVRERPATHGRTARDEAYDQGEPGPEAMNRLRRILEATR